MLRGRRRKVAIQRTDNELRWLDRDIEQRLQEVEKRVLDTPQEVEEDSPYDSRFNIPSYS
jgi:hypothetical protein